MNRRSINSWREIETEVLNRIQSRVWAPGFLIPNEAELAKEFGCARATVNRALRAVADAGLLDRKRKAGTRVATHPVRTAKLTIPIIRHEIEQQNQTYSHMLVASELSTPPLHVRAHMKLAENSAALSVEAVHMADQRPYVHENRWINPESVPDILTLDLANNNANEWLVAHAPFTRGDIGISAIQADAKLADIFDTQVNDALIVVDRTTWNIDQSITMVRLTYHAGYRMRTVV